MSAATSGIGFTTSGLGGLSLPSQSQLTQQFSSFVGSSTIVAQVAFLALVVIVFMIALRIGAQVIAYALTPSSDPYLVKGTVSGRTMLTIPQRPGAPGAVTLLRSRNQTGGIEFTWSTWILIEDLEYRQGSYRNVFNKGSGDQGATGARPGGQSGDGPNFPNNAPGLYIAPNTNALVVVMNTFTTPTEELTVSDIPLNKWLNVIIRVTGRVLDVYINGTIAARKVLDDVPKQNYGDVYVGANGGFDGLISSLRYYNHSLSASEIFAVSQAGPDLSMAKQVSVSPPYFALRWYFDGLNA